jgi:SEC-C motif-containing protein
MPEIDASARCPCGTGLTYGECCGPYLAGEMQPLTAERMMRSRYTAYAVRSAGYLLATWHSSTRPSTLVLDPETEWIGLEILGRTGGGILDNRGTVEFRATYRNDGARLRQQENSSFVRANKNWFYVDGTISA